MEFTFVCIQKWSRLINCKPKKRQWKYVLIQWILCVLVQAQDSNGNYILKGTVSKCVE
jgi:hypothetical protein